MSIHVQISQRNESILKVMVRKDNLLARSCCNAIMVDETIDNSSCHVFLMSKQWI